MSATIQHKKESDGRHWGTTPFGCDRDPDTKHLIASQTVYFYHPSGEALAQAEAEQEPPPGFEARFYHDALHDLFITYAAGDYSYSHIAETMNKRGWRMWQRDRRTPKPFTRISAYSILNRWPIYAGYLPVDSDNEELRPAGHYPILRVELCHAVGKVLKRRRQTRSPNRNQTTYLLSGVLVCGQCGQSLGGQTMKNGRYRYYRHVYSRGDCPESSSYADELDRQVIDALQELVQNKEVVAEVMSRIRKALEIEALEKAAGAEAGLFTRLEQKRAALDRLIDAYVDGLITKEQLSQRQAPLVSDIERLERIVSTPQIETLAGIQQDLDKRLGEIGGIDESDPELLKIVIQGLFKRLEAEGGQIVAAEPQDGIAPLVDVLQLFAPANSDCQLSSLKIFIWLPMGQAAEAAELSHF